MNNGKNIDFGLAKNLAGAQEQQLHFSDSFPPGDFCPMQPAMTFPKKDGDKMIIVRVYNPCLPAKCACANAERTGCGITK